MSKDELNRLFLKYNVVGHEIYDLNKTPIKLGDMVFNSKTCSETIIDERAIKTFDFGVEVLGLSPIMKNLKIIEEPEDLPYGLGENKEPEEDEILLTEDIEENENEEAVREISLDEEDEVDEWEYACNECEMPKAKKIDLSKSKELKRLEKLFDMIEITQYDKFQTLTIKDRADRENMDWQVWIDVKIEKNGGGSKNYGNNKSTDEYMLGAIKQIDTFSKLITKFKDDNTKKTLSLFEDEDNKDIVLEKKPERPDMEADQREWSKYYREVERVDLENAMKQYEFLDLVHLSDSWYSYLDDDNELFNFENHLPKNDKEMIELVKESIIEVTKEDRKAHGRFHGFWWDNSCQYLEYGGKFSDVELISRVIQITRLHLVPYKAYKEVFVDDANTFHRFHNANETSYHFYFDRGCINGRHFDSLTSVSKKKTKKYNLYDEEFITWLREWFKLEYKEPMNDEEAIAASIEYYYNRVIDKEKFSFKELALECKSEKEYVSKINKYLTVNKLYQNSCGGSIGTATDGYGGFISMNGGKKDEIKIDRKVMVCNWLGMDLDEEEHGYSIDIIKLVGADIHKKAFELFCDKEELERQANLGQKSLF